MSSNDIRIKDRNCISLSKKFEIIRRIEAGERAIDVSNLLNVPISSIRTTMKNKDKIRLDVSTSTKLQYSKFRRSRPSIIEEMEKMLCVWIYEQNQLGRRLYQLEIMEKAKSIFNHIQNKTKNFSETFAASRGWLYRFKRRCNLQDNQLSEEAACTNQQAAENFPIKFQEIVNNGNYNPQLIFTIGKTILFFNRTMLSVQEDNESNLTSVPEDRITLLLGSNATGDIKLQPFLIYHSKTPEFIHNLTISSNLSGIWQSNKSTCFTFALFQNWLENNFCPFVKKICIERDLKPKVLLLLENPSEYPNQLKSLKIPIELKLVFLPADKTLTFKHMDQMLIEKFKINFSRCVSKQISNITNQRRVTGSDIWKYEEIRNGLQNLKSAWDSISDESIKDAWKYMLPLKAESLDINNDFPVTKLNFYKESYNSENEQQNEENINNNKDICIENILQFDCNHYDEVENFQNEEKTIITENYKKLYDGPTSQSSQSPCEEKSQINISDDVEESRNNSSDEKKLNEDLIFNTIIEKKIEETSSCKSDYETETFSIEFVKKNIAKITNDLDEFLEKDIDRKRSAKVKFKVKKALSCYEKFCLQGEKKKKQKQKSDDLKKKLKNSSKKHSHRS